MPCRGTARSSITNAARRCSGPCSLIRRSSSAPVKSLSSAHDPAETGGDRVGVRPDVVAVQRVADLQPQAVARTEPAGRDPALEHRVPERAGLVGHHHQLDTLLAGVAGAVDHAGDAADLALGERERGRVRQAEPLERAGPLDGDQPVLVGDVAHVGARHLALLQPRVVGLAVRRVDDQQVPERIELVRDQVVDRSRRARSSGACTAPGRARSARGRSRAATGAARVRAAPRPRSRPCATRRRRRSPRGPPGAPGSRPRTAPACPSRRTAPSARRGRRGGRAAACGGASPAPAVMLLHPGRLTPATGRTRAHEPGAGPGRARSGAPRRAARAAPMSWTRCSPCRTARRGRLHRRASVRRSPRSPSIAGPEPDRRPRRRPVPLRSAAARDRPPGVEIARAARSPHPM